MSEIKAFEFGIDWKDFGVCLTFCLDREFPGLMLVMFGPISFCINKPRYWKRKP